MKDKNMQDFETFMNDDFKYYYNQFKRVLTDNQSIVSLKLLGDKGSSNQITLNKDSLEALNKFVEDHPEVLYKRS